jgi:hypothetical protein
MEKDVFIKPIYEKKNTFKLQKKNDLKKRWGRKEIK